MILSEEAQRHTHTHTHIHIQRKHNEIYQTLKGGGMGIKWKG
jgi:hypothetical protein